VIAVRIARRLVRRLTKPAALWLNAQQLRRSEVLANHYHELRTELIGMELDMRKQAVVLAERRNQIRTW
jgi:hypothetical protein